MGGGGRALGGVWKNVFHEPLLYLLSMDKWGGGVKGRDQ